MSSWTDWGLVSLQKTSKAIACSLVVQHDWRAWSNEHGAEHVLKNVRLKKHALEGGAFALDSNLDAGQIAGMLIFKQGAANHLGDQQNAEHTRRTTGDILSSYFKPQELDKHGNVSLQFNLEEEYWVNSLEVCNPPASTCCGTQLVEIKILVENQVHVDERLWEDVGKFEMPSDKPNYKFPFPALTRDRMTQFVQITLINTGKHHNIKDIGLCYVELRGIAVDQKRRMAIAVSGKAPVVILHKLDHF